MKKPTFYAQRLTCCVPTASLRLAILALIGATAPHACSAEPPNTEIISDQFHAKVAPLIDSACVSCHDADDPQGGLDLASFDRVDKITKHFAVWELIRRRVKDAEMPPPDSGERLSDADRRTIVSWINNLRNDHIRRFAGDPGEVLAHRLSSAEYNNSIRDLTGIDLRPAATFPIDPTNEAGFDNSGESLTMTPALMEKYILAARHVADHLVFKPDGLDFAPHPVVTATDRDKYCVRKIIDFYERHNTKLADYLSAAVQLGPRAAPLSIEQSAMRNGLSQRYLSTISDWLYSQINHPGPLRTLRDELFDCKSAGNKFDRARVDTIAKRMIKLRSQLGFEFPHLQVEGINNGSQPFVLWRNRQQASHRMKLNRQRLAQVFESIGTGDTANAKASLTDEAVSAFEVFCRVIPDRFYVDRRGRQYVDRDQDDFKRESDYRLLSAGFHSMMGYFRDDQPLTELLLSVEQQRELDQLWFELDFIADAPRRQHSGFVWFERAEGRYLVDAEFDDYQAADKDVASESKINGLRDAYIEKAKRIGADQLALQAMSVHFEAINKSVRRVESAWETAQYRQLEAVDRFAERAFRRPLTTSEREENHAFYRRLVTQDGLIHQDAVRDLIVSILVSPHFSYRSLGAMHSTTKDSNIQDSNSIEAIDSYHLASRLSYFLWASLPDEALLIRAEGNELQDTQILQAEVHRMLKDSKSKGLAMEFCGNWLGFRHFESHNGVDRQRFPQFDDRLRSAMFGEALHFSWDVIQNKRSVLDFLYSNRTFVNKALARHYGIAWEDDRNSNEWIAVEDADRYGRGGVLPMAVFMTKHSPGLRTSPVKRGYWVVRQLLGTPIPPPPPDVPDLPEDESMLGGLTLRQVLEKHREHPSCSACHEKFDSFGLVFESFGPTGQFRKRDLGGNPVDTTANFPDGLDRQGLAGLREYLRSGRENDFVKTLCEKLLTYGLGRSLILSDQPLVDSLVEDVMSGSNTFEHLITRIVTSRQFRTKRRGSRP